MCPSGVHHGPVVENWIPKIVSSIQPQVSQTGKLQLTSNRPIALFPLFVKVSRFDGKMGKEDMVVCHVFAFLADVERFQHSPPGM
ncbi:hypothetical protein T10_11200 [Trichinella papuae]|uniref:Uncharacterized protein n=1 Tax=Trichinella papuae TaxID=268474 RepID=A0A0V1MDB0_9BILA|nr:hypothetical protein T10_11200 [Trichinella papuae]